MMKIKITALWDEGVKDLGGSFESDESAESILHLLQKYGRASAELDEKTGEWTLYFENDYD